MSVCADPAKLEQTSELASQSGNPKRGFQPALAPNHHQCSYNQRLLTTASSLASPTILGTVNIAVYLRLEAEAPSLRQPEQDSCGDAHKGTRSLSQLRLSSTAGHRGRSGHWEVRSISPARSHWTSLRPRPLSSASASTGLVRSPAHFGRASQLEPRQLLS
jgi:hypothetical protein